MAIFIAPSVSSCFSILFPAFARTSCSGSEDVCGIRCPTSLFSNELQEKLPVVMKRERMKRLAVIMKSRRKKVVR
jgi:hypothetical protein